MLAPIFHYVDHPYIQAFWYVLPAYSLSFHFLYEHNKDRGPLLNMYLGMFTRRGSCFNGMDKGMDKFPNQFALSTVVLKVHINSANTSYSK